MSSRDPQHVRRRGSHVEIPHWANYALMGLFVVAVLALGYFTFNAVKNLIAGLPGSAEQPDEPEASGGEGEAGVVEPGEEGSTEYVWDEGRVTVLLLGIDERRSEQGPWRTDTMILVTIDPATKSAAMLSMPRDLWVEIPGYDGYDKINTAHFKGDADQYPEGGPGLAMKTVQQNFGVPVQYFASINFYAFVSIIDRLECVPIDVPETIDDPDYPAAEGSGFDPFHIDAGHHCMGGETLLKYARTRATFGSDFDRAARQQAVIMSIRDHVLDTNRLPTLITQAPLIFEDIRSGVNTNFSLDQMRALALLASEIPEENICRAVISGEYVEEMKTLEDQSQVIIWNREKVRALVDEMFSGTGGCTPATVPQEASPELAELARAENARINILNGTNQAGLATDTSNILTGAGLSSITIGNADRFDYTQTIIYNYTGKEATARFIAQLLGVPETAIQTAAPTTTLYDIEIVLGSDFKN
jgi:polyisoprenyl-teichoic acid--peptidoglycan teichoic acid transferase